MSGNGSEKGEIDPKRARSWVILAGLNWLSRINLDARSSPRKHSRPDLCCEERPAKMGKVSHLVRLLSDATK